MEELTRTQRDLLQDIIDAPNLGLAVYKAVRDENNRIIDFIHEYINRKTLQTLGQDMTNKLLSDHGPNGYDQLPMFIEAIEKEKTITYVKHAHFNDADHWISFSNAPLGNDRLLHIWEDISDKKRMEIELVNTKLRQQKEILNAIVLAQEEERQRIGVDLHDSVAQLLYGIQTRLQLLNSDNTLAQQKIDDIMDLVHEAISDTRRVSFQLVPSVLKDFGLETALKTLFQRLIPKNMKVKLQVSGMKERLSPNLEFAIFRIVQELTNNAIRHSQASLFEVEIELTDKLVHVSVSDNGIGFNEAELDPVKTGIGLQSIRNRISLLDGTITFKSSGHGTSVDIALPVH